jgi:predicted amidohydrolase
MKTIRLRLFQSDIRNSINENLSLIENISQMKWSPQNIDISNYISQKTMNRESQSSCDVLVLPELFTTGYHSPEKMHELAEDINGPTVSTLKRITRENNISIGAGSFIEKDGDRYYNTSISMNSKGQLLNRYRKTHLFTPMGEEEMFSPGDRLTTFKCFDTIIGVLTCYELRFPEIARRLALDGAKIIFCPVNWPHPRADIMYNLARARAIENQLFFVVVNRVGTQGKWYFCGQSMVCAPDGKVLALGSEENEERIDVEINLEDVEKYRQEIPSLKERRPEIY